MSVEATAPRSGGGDGAEAGSDRAVVLDAVDVRVVGTPVLHGVGLQVAAGEVIGLVGPNGSGKSTLLRVLATLLRPAAGTGRVLGARLGSAEVLSVRPSIALIGHEPALYARLSLLENLRHLARLTGREGRSPGDALAAVGLYGARHRKAAHCSHGMLRRAELARVLVTRPRLLLLDEAHSGLDGSSSGLVEVVVAGVRRDGGASVLVSHEHGRLSAVVDRVMGLAAGGLHPVGGTQ